MAEIDPGKHLSLVRVCIWPCSPSPDPTCAAAAAALAVATLKPAPSNPSSTHPPHPPISNRGPALSAAHARLRESQGIWPQDVFHGCHHPLHGGPAGLAFPSPDGSVAGQGHVAPRPAWGRRRRRQQGKARRGVHDCRLVSALDGLAVCLRAALRRGGLYVRGFWVVWGGSLDDPFPSFSNRHGWLHIICHKLLLILFLSFSSLLIHPPLSLYIDVFFLDCYAPVGIDGTASSEAVLHPRIYALGLMREFFAGQTLFMHGSIAYCIHSYIVLKVRT